MRLVPNVTWKLFAALAACVAIGLGTFIGISSAASSSGSTGLANTSGAGGHGYTFHTAGAAVGVSALSAPTQAELGQVQATSALPLATVSSGNQATEVYAVRTASGATCIEVTYAGGTIAEPANCASDAYLRTWTVASGVGNPDSATPSSEQVVIAVSTDVQTVHVAYTDGSSRDFAPDGNGLVLIESRAGALPTAVSALNAAGVTLAAMVV